MAYQAVKTDMIGTIKTSLKKSELNKITETVMNEK